MDRPPRQPRRDSFRTSDQAPYDEVVNRFAPGAAATGKHVEVGAYFGAMLNSPDLCAMSSQLGLYFRAVGNAPGSYSHADREFVDQVLSAYWRTNVVQVTHIVDAAEAGVRVDAIEALMAGRDDLLNEDELLLTTYIRQVVDGKVERPIYDRMGKRLGTRGLVEYTGFILWLQWIMRMMQALDTGAISDEEVKERLKDARKVEAARLKKPSG
jgi:hypothetical protein